MLVKPRILSLRRTHMVLSIAALLVLVLTWTYPWSRGLVIDYLPGIPILGKDSKESSPPSSLTAPPEYGSPIHRPQYCTERFTVRYLETIRNDSVQYCDHADSTSSITCFRKRWDDRIDTMCVGKSAVFDPSQQKFVLPCRLRPLNGTDVANRVEEFYTLHGYWYDTGAGWLVNNLVELDSRVTPVQSDNDLIPTPTLTPAPQSPAPRRKYTVLLKREGETNPWHCMAEIFSLYLTFDVLRMSRDTMSPTLDPFFSLPDAENTRIVIIDDRKDGPYFDLWRLFAKRPPEHVKDLRAETEEEESIIIPLAGASNPMWFGDWEIHGCRDSELLRTFASRIRGYYDIGAFDGDKETPSQPRSGNIRVTYVDRKETRRLQNQESYLDEARTLFPHIDLQAVDFASISFQEQVRTVWETDVLIGVHGAGLTHAMFMRPGSALVEILPEGLYYHCYRNLAGLSGMKYFSTHATNVPPPGNHDAAPVKREDSAKRTATIPSQYENSGDADDVRAQAWPEEAETPSERKLLRKRASYHTTDVALEKARFMELLEAAIKSMYSSGIRDFDVV